MHDYLANVVTQAPERKELFVGDVIQAALLQGLPVQTVLFPTGKCLDIGLPENLVKAVRDFTSLT
jgi:glucose-1-phosphate thymidylyltransferase